MEYKLPITPVSTIVLPDTSGKYPEMTLFEYLYTIPKDNRKKVFNDLVKQERVFTREINNNIVGFVKF